MNFRFAGKQRILVIGVYPAVSHVDARKRRDETREPLIEDTDPSLAKAINKQIAQYAAENTFKAVALEWYAKNTPAWAVRPQQISNIILKEIFFPG